MITLALLACGPTPRTWVPVDEAALQARLDSPTAARPDRSAVAEELGDVIAAGGDLESIPDTLDPVLAEPGTDPPPAPEDDVISGTSAFFDIACPGVTGVPDPDFALGTMRLESPFLLEDGSQLAIGPVYLTFGQCEIVDTVVDGEMRASWLADDQRLLATGEVDVRTGGSFEPWDAAFAVDPGGFVLSYTLDRGTVTLTFGTDTVRADFADGAFACTRTQPPTCSEAK